MRSNVDFYSSYEEEGNLYEEMNQLTDQPAQLTGLESAKMHNFS